MSRAVRQDEFSALMARQGAVGAWEALDVEGRRRLVGTLMAVTLLPAPRGIKSFDPSSVSIEWHRAV